MSMSDPIADMLTRIRNAARAGLPSVRIPQSRLKAEIARILKREGYLNGIEVEPNDGKPMLRLDLKYGPDRQPVIQGLRRVSRPGLRQYRPSTSLPKVLNGLGVAIISTSQGVITDRDARHRKIGGEVLCHIW